MRRVHAFFGLVVLAGCGDVAIDPDLTGLPAGLGRIGLALESEGAMPEGLHAVLSVTPLDADGTELELSWSLNAAAVAQQIDLVPGSYDVDVVVEDDYGTALYSGSADDVAVVSAALTSVPIALVPASGALEIFAEIGRGGVDWGTCSLALTNTGFGVDALGKPIGPIQRWMTAERVDDTPTGPQRRHYVWTGSRDASNKMGPWQLWRFDDPTAIDFSNHAAYQGVAGLTQTLLVTNALFYPACDDVTVLGGDFYAVCTDLGVTLWKSHDGLAWERVTTIKTDLRQTSYRNGTQTITFNDRVARCQLLADDALRLVCSVIDASGSSGATVHFDHGFVVMTAADDHTFETPDGGRVLPPQSKPVATGNPDPGIIYSGIPGAIGPNNGPANAVGPGPSFMVPVDLVKEGGVYRLWLTHVANSDTVGKLLVTESIDFVHWSALRETDLPCAWNNYFYPGFANGASLDPQPLLFADDDHYVYQYITSDIGNAGPFFRSVSAR